MNDLAIQVVTVNWYSSSYIARLVQNLTIKSDSPDHLHFLVIDNTNGEDTLLYNLQKEIPKMRVELFNGSRKQRSISHASALNHAMQFLDSQFTLIVDPDIHVFADGWDSLCKQALEESSAIAMGAPYPSWKLGKIHDFPSPIFMFIDTNYLAASDVNWYPFPRLPRRISNFFTRKFLRMGIIGSKRRLEKYNNLRKFSGWMEEKIGVCSPDTGWLIAKKMKEMEKKSIVFEAIYSDDIRISNSDSHQLLKTMARNFELYLFCDQPFMVHQYGSGVIHWKTSKSTNEEYWLQCIREYDQFLSNK